MKRGTILKHFISEDFRDVCNASVFQKPRPVEKMIRCKVLRAYQATIFRYTYKNLLIKRSTQISRDLNVSQSDEKKRTFDNRTI